MIYRFRGGERRARRVSYAPTPPCTHIYHALFTVHAAVTANTFAVYGAGHVKELTELVPGILNQLGPDSLASLRKLAESYQAIQQSQQRPPAAAADEEDDDDDVPDLVENFDAVEDKAADEEKKPDLD